MNDYRRAAGKHRMWFGSYTRAGELKKVQVWCFLNGGAIEFMTEDGSYKVRRARRNPRVICYLGSEDGPAVQGMAEVISHRAVVERGYRTYWAAHPWMMLLLWWPIRNRIKSGRQVLIRVRPDEPNPLAGITDPVL